MKIFKSTCLNIHVKHFTFSYLVRKLFLSKGFLVKRGLLIAAQDMHSFDLKTELYKVHDAHQVTCLDGLGTIAGFFGCVSCRRACLASGECNLFLIFSRQRLMLFQTFTQYLRNFCGLIM